MGRQVSVSQAAERLGVTPHRVRQRIEGGSLPAERVGHRWSIDEADLLPLLGDAKVGRPLSERSAWAILDLADGSTPALTAFLRLTLTERQRARERWRLLAACTKDLAITTGVAQMLREMLLNRADRQVFRANARDVADLRADPRLVPSGLSDPRAEIAAGDIVEGYVLRGDAERFARDYLLTRAIGQSHRQEANVVLHVSARPITRPVPELLIAADLADHRTPREESRALEIVQDLTRNHARRAGGKEDQ